MFVEEHNLEYVSFPENSFEVVGSRTDQICHFDLRMPKGKYVYCNPHEYLNVREVVTLCFATYMLKVFATYKSFMS